MFYVIMEETVMYLRLSQDRGQTAALQKYGLLQHEQTPVLQDKAESGSAGQVFNGFVLSSEALTVLLDLLRSATIQTLVFLFCLLYLVLLSTALSSESLRRCWPFTKRFNS